jgi:hypothetical protein
MILVLWKALILSEKKILNLPAAEINMIIGCGIRDESGIYGNDSVFL